MVDRVDQMFVRQARVGGVHHCPKARHGEEQLEMAVVVP